MPVQTDHSADEIKGIATGLADLRIEFAGASGPIKSITRSGRSSSGWTRSCSRPSRCEVLVRGMEPRRRGTDSSLISAEEALSCASCTFPP